MQYNATTREERLNIADARQQLPGAGSTDALPSLLSAMLSDQIFRKLVAKGKRPLRI
jgi:hypothetical protein